jgi:hypothetical protein
MSKRAEQAAKEIYKDGIELFGRRDRNGNLIIHPETMIGILRNACQKGYEQAEKDLALTWEDIKTIEQIIATSDWYDFEINGKLWSKEFYEEVLNRFNKSKEE